MTRCQQISFSPFLMMFAFVLLWAASSYLGLVGAQTMPRQFPPAAKRAVLQVTAPPEVLLNGQPERLSPGARIKGVNNLMVMSAALVDTSVLVNYKLDMQGLIHEVWILSEEEASEPRVGMEPVTNFIFGSQADKPKTDDGKTPFDQLPKYSGQ